MSKVIIDEKYCKGCGLCVGVCPQHILALDEHKLTAKGYRPASLIDESKCTACTTCALVCPDVAITVVKE